MICVSGLPDESLDEGMDALDFGVRRDPRHRGVMVARGLGFFRGGVIDQHFGQYRGRLGRLARVLIEERVRYGFGIDENTALAVEPDGSFEVLGHGSVTIVDASMARCADGPLGCRITGLRLSCLHEGDRFDPRTGAAVIHPGRDPIVPGQESYNGNFLVPDIAGEGAVWSALFAGLVDNASHEQVGITLKHAGPHAHGYRFTFREADGTQGYAGYVNGVYSYAVLGVALEIEPVAGPLQRPEELLPADLRDGPLGTAGKALWFRGVLLADSEGRFRPHQPITRAELAGALARAVHLEPPRSNPPEIADVAMSSPLAGDVVKVVSAGWMPLDASGAFAPDGTLTREQAAAVLVRAAHTDLPSLEQAVRTVAVDDAADITPDLRAAAVAALEAGLLTAGETRFRPADALTRGEAAQALGRIIGFTWSRDAD
jgi:hypothetical protein